MAHTDYCIPDLEWEADIFPVKLHDIAFPDGEFILQMPVECQLYRDKDYLLVCEMHAPLEALQQRQENQYIGKGNIITGCTIHAGDEHGNKYILENCIISLRQSSSAPGYPAVREINMRSVTIKRNVIPANDTKTLYWFLCGDHRAHFKNVTRRNKNQLIPKARIDTDASDVALDTMPGSSLSKDHFTLEVPGHECIISKVPTDFVPDWAAGICIEYGGAPDRSLEHSSQIISDFLSFLLGTELLGIGYTALSGNDVIESFHTSPHESPLQEQIIDAMAPIHFNMQYPWGDAEWLTQNLLPEFARIYQPMQLDKVLSRYFKSRTIPLGVNLPVMATAIEILAASYLKMNNLFDEKYISDQDWQDFMKTIPELKQKLDQFSGGDKMFNKIRDANRRNPAEKIGLFFSNVGIETGSLEKKALALRNKMTHGARDYSDIDLAHEDIVLTRVYQSLFHRTLLKLLGYSEYYIDYSLQGSPSKSIIRSAGDSNKKTN